MHCPNCAADGVTSRMLFYPGEEWEDGSKDRDIYTCPDCGHEEVVRD